jgi:hypothetical protein
VVTGVVAVVCGSSPTANQLVSSTDASKLTVPVNVPLTSSVFKNSRSGFS